MATKTKVDMSTKVGGRLVTPALPVVDSSDPTPVERSFQESLQVYIDDNIPLESTDGIQRRERALNRMGVLVREWIRSVCTKRGLPQDVIDSAGGQLFTSGSYRLGVHEPGADIDTILVAPNMCTRQDFFGAVVEEPENGTVVLVRDPESLAERIRAHPDVTNFVPVEGAMIPLLTFDWEGVNIDLLFARLNSATVPASLDIDNDAVLDGVDSATEKSLNGPRVTNLIAALVSGTPERYQNFLTVVRCVRKWAKARGLYSNKMGYWGGVNINISVALVVQLYPMATQASLLRKFFLVFKSWRWPNPVMLTKPHDAGYGLPVWSAQHVHNARQVAPIITPAYPAMNSTVSVSRQTLQIMHEEFCRGHEIVDKLWKQHQSNPSDPLVWDDLFQPSDFFISYPNYISICIVGSTQADAQAWAGFVESRLRKLVSDMLGRSLPLSKIQLWPKKFEMCIADKGVLLTQAQRKNCITYFVGFHVETIRMRGNHLNVEMQLQNFREWELSRFQPLVPGMDVLVKPFKVKELPGVVFKDSYKGGKEEAMKKRREMRNADPRLQEKRRLARLQGLKAKMAEIQRKKEEKSETPVEDAEEADDVSMDSKRKREEDAPDDGRESKMAKTEDTDEQIGTNVAVNEPHLSEEADLLEHALDTIQEDAAAGAKTREEAEADRQKLLAGALLTEGDDVSDEDDEIGYMGDGARQILLPAVKAKQDNAKRDIRSLPLGEEEAEILRKLGCAIEDSTTVGGNMILPWRRPEVVEGNSHEKKPIKFAKINFRTNFDIVELDANGHIVDKGDEDYTPSSKWFGRKAGFEFKLGERGLGYYRTGKKVVVPSNTAY
jgi:poly(A) polymerase